jgi:HAUS augmin-like complex subunit 6 N-terminus
LNLRGALYRALTDLKKDGILGKEILLRKTMLDECRGEKFEEVICAFAMTVLRKVAQVRNDAQLELSCSNRLTRQQDAQLLPLIIAHRRSLDQQVSQHCKIKEHAQVYNGLLAQHRASIEDRRARLSKLPLPEAGEKAGTYQDISDSWVGDERWVEILVSGPTRSEDQFLQMPFEKGWKAVLDESNVDVGPQTNLLEDLNARIANQEMRLRKWKIFAASLCNTQARRQNVSPTRAWAEECNSAVLQFDRHQSLHLSDEPLLPRSVDQNFPATSIHNALLASLEADLAMLGRCNMAKQSTARGERLEDPYKLPRNAFQTSPALPMFTSASHMSDELSRAGQSLHKDTPGHSRELISAVSQRVESLPSGNTAPIYPRALNQFSQVENEIKFYEEPVLSYSADQPALTRREGSPRVEIIPPEDFRTLEEPDKLQMMQSSSAVTKGTSKYFAARRDENELEEQIEPFVSERLVNPSKFEPESIMTVKNGVRSMAPLPSLLERTRQSMSLLPNAVDRARLRSSEKRASSKQVRLSQAFPINQFETPRKVKPNEISRLETNPPRSESSTPRDELLSDAAAYDSVFKSRPRIALSPALSPDRSGMGLDSMLEEDLVDLTLEVDI